MFYLFFTLLCITQANSYVLLQVSKDSQNRSNVDALIHKVVPSDQFDILAKKIARKNFNNQENRIASETEQHSSSLENDGINDAIKEFIETKPEFRTRDFNIKPKIINLRSKEPSLMYEVNSNIIIKAIKDFLSSKLVAQYADDVGKRAAAVYRSMRKNN